MSHQLDTIDLQILKLIAEDKTIKELAPMVNRSYEGVKSRIKKLKELARCSSNTALVMYFSDEIKALKEAT